MTFELAACAEMLWLDKPIDWRASRLKEIGFGVGLWNWPDHDIDALAKTGARFTIMNGYLEGRLADDEGADAAGLCRKPHRLANALVWRA